MASITLFGRLTKDPESRTVNGQSVCKFSVADMDKPYSKDGGRDQPSSFFTCEIWGKRGEVISNYFTKGQRILVSGTLLPNHWTNKNGDLVKDHLLKVNEFNFIEQRKDQQSSGGGSDLFATAPSTEIPF